MRALIFASLLLQAPWLYAAGGNAAQFLNLGFGARALGMGEAFTAVADDASCVYYNPAGLASGDGRRELLLSHAWHVQDTSVSQAAFMRRPWAFSATYFSAGELEGRDAMAAPTGDFTASDFAGQVSRGFRLGEFSAGASAKFVSQRIKSSGASALAADLGILYRPEGSRLSFGAAMSNLGGRLKFEDESFPLPLRLKAGAAARLYGGKLLLALDGEFPDAGPALARLGAEYRGLEGIALRAGYRTSSSQQRDALLGKGFDGASGTDALFGFFAGVGFAYRGFTLDYAMLPYGDLGSSHRFSLGARF